MGSERGRSRLGRALRRAARLACPRCGGAPLFPRDAPSGGRVAAGRSTVRRAVRSLGNRFSMARECARCGLRFERAQGYFVGAIYLNYAVTSLIAIGGYLVLWWLTELSTAAQLALWLPVVVLFPLWFFPYSRSLWLALEWALNPEP